MASKRRPSSASSSTASKYMSLASLASSAALAPSRGGIPRRAASRIDRGPSKGPSTSTLLLTTSGTTPLAQIALKKPSAAAEADEYSLGTGRD